MARFSSGHFAATGTIPFVGATCRIGWRTTFVSTRIFRTCRSFLGRSRDCWLLGRLSGQWDGGPQRHIGIALSICPHRTTEQKRRTKNTLTHMTELQAARGVNLPLGALFPMTRRIWARPRQPLPPGKARPASIHPDTMRVERCVADKDTSRHDTATQKPCIICVQCLEAPRRGCGGVVIPEFLEWVKIFLPAWRSTTIFAGNRSHRHSFILFHRIR